MNDWKDITGLILDEEGDPNTALDQLVENMTIILKLKGQEQPFAFNITSNKELRNLILDQLDESHEQFSKGN